MKRPTSILAGMILVSGSVASTAQDEHSTAQDEHVLRAQAQEAIANTFSTMSGSLMKALSEGGVEKAVPFCHENVKQLATKLHEQNGVRVQRVTHKARNPVNQATAEELKLIDSIRAKLDQGKTPDPIMTTNEKGTRVYYAPILIPAETCLKCHGQPETDILPADLQLIRSLYPQDQATGFKLGDLRGLWKITFESPTPSKP